MKRGGKRQGAGRKPAYTEPVKVVRVSIPASKEAELKQIAEQWRSAVKR